MKAHDYLRKLSESQAYLPPECIEESDGRCIHPQHKHFEKEMDAGLERVLIYNTARGRYFRNVGEGMTDKRTEAHRFTRTQAESLVSNLDDRAKHLRVVPALD